MNNYMQLQKVIAQELNVHEVSQKVGDKIEICFWTSLGFNDKPDELYLKVLGIRVDPGEEVLERVISSP